MSGRMKNFECPCRVLGDMAFEEVLCTTIGKYAHNGLIQARLLSSARADLEKTIIDFENSPAGDSSRNELVLSLVKRTFTDRLRLVAEYLDRAIESKYSVALEELRI